MTLYGGNPDVSMRQRGLLVVYASIMQSSHFHTVSWSAVYRTHNTKADISSQILLPGISHSP